MGSRSGDIKGFRYRWTMLMGLCRGPIDAIKDIKVADRRVWPADVATNMAPSNVEVPSSLLLVEPFLANNPIEGDPDLGTAIYRLGVYTIPVTNPPWVPGQHAQFSGFNRNFRESVEADIVSATVDGTYEILAPIGGEFLEGILQIRCTQVQYDQFLIYGYRPIHFTTSNVPPPGRVQAIDWTDDQLDIVQPPNSQEITNNSTHLIDQYEIFGGDESEGGILGWFTALFGWPDQGQNESMLRMRGANVPAFRDRVTAVYRGIVAANNPYPKPWAFRTVRRLRGWDGDVWHPELVAINMTRTLGPDERTPWPLISAMNPAHILYECYTNRTWGRGLPRDALDDASFLAAATQLAAEGFGLCLRWTRTDEISAFVQSILDHISAAVNPDRVTGKIKLDLIRGGYDPNTVPLFTFSTGLLAITEAAVAQTPSYVNEIRVTYIDPITNQQGTVGVQNLAALQATGGQVHSLTRDFPGIPTAALARRVAQRELKTLGVGLRKFTVQCDRRAWALRPGGLMRIQDPRRGIEPIVLRIGTMRDNGVIDIEAVEDVFTMPSDSFIGEQVSTWQPPSTLPCVAPFEAFEVPYALLASRHTADEIEGLTDGTGLVGVAIAPGQPMNRQVELAVRSGAFEPEDVPPSDTYYCGYEE